MMMKLAKRTSITTCKLLTNYRITGQAAVSTITTDDDDEQPITSSTITMGESVKSIRAKMMASTNDLIIPRVQTFFPTPIALPHPETKKLIDETEQWAKELAAKSIVDHQTRQYLDTLDKDHIWDATCLYSSFACDPNCDYKKLFELTKNTVFAMMINDLIRFEQKTLVKQELFDYLKLFLDDPELVHDHTQDSKRPYLINLLGHSINGLRNGGASPMQIRRLTEALNLFIRINIEPPNKIDWHKYWQFRRENAFLETVAIPAEIVGGIEDIPESIINDPDVHSAQTAALGMIFATNDLVSYFRERVTDEAYQNHVTFLMLMCEHDEQSAVDRVCEHIISLNMQFVMYTRMAVTSPIVRQHKELDSYMKHILPRLTYGLCQSYDLLSRNRLDGKRNNFVDDGWWVCDEAFVNESDPANAGKNFEEYLKKFDYLNVYNQEFL